MCAALAQEPWCYAPGVIGQLTDLQVLKLYIEPAAERAKEMRRDSPPSGTALGTRPSREKGTGPDGEPGSATHREQCVRALMSTLGLKPERAAKEYERQLAIYRAERGT